MQELGQADPIWKIFGSMAAFPMTIPLYLVVDKGGTIRYAVWGGDDLKDLWNLLVEVWR